MCLLVLAASLLFAGGQKEEAAEGGEQQEETTEKEPVTLRYSHFIGPDQYGKALEAWAEEYEEQNPNVTIKIEMTPWSGYWSKLQTSIAGGTEADVIQMSGASLFKFAPNNVLLNMNPYLEKEGLSFDEFYQAALDEVTWEGKMYSMPFGVGTGSVFYYNKDIYDDVGLDYPDNNYTVEQWIADGKKITASTGSDGESNRYGTLAKAYYEFWPLIWDNGGQVLNEDKTKCMLDQPEAIEAFQLMYDMVHKHKISPTYAQIEGIGDFFQTGRLGTYVAGSWYMSTYDKIDEFDWGFTVWPKWKGKRIADVYIGGNQHSISANTENPDEAWNFVYFMTNKLMENTNEYGLGIPAVKKVADKVITPDARIYPLLEQVPDGHSLDFHPNWSEMVDIYYTEIAKPMLNGKMTPKEAGELAVELIDPLLQ